jgi:hypothetical protein
VQYSPVQLRRMLCCISAHYIQRYLLSALPRLAPKAAVTALRAIHVRIRVDHQHNSSRVKRHLHFNVACRHGNLDCLKRSPGHRCKYRER